MRRADTLIVGGGPAGAAAAILLARAGRAPVLIEKRERPGGIVCGGFLGWDALASLRLLGIDPSALGAVPITCVKIIAGRHVAETRLPAQAAGLSRATLDEAMLALADAEGAQLLRGVAARRVDVTTAELADGSRVSGERLILATGKYALRGATRDASGGSVGLRAAVAAPASLAGTIELHLFRGGYAGLLTQEDGRANLCLSVAPERLREAGGQPEALLADLAREAPAIAELGATAAHWDAIAAVPYGWRTASTTPATYRVGDQAAVIASLAGDGIAIALAGGRAAAAAILAGDSAERFQASFARRAAAPIDRAETIRGIAEAPRPAALAVACIGRAPWIARAAARLTRIGH
ncbi:FAD-dependent oxidoreductase [Sphingomonas sp. BIUV-7]|uniref:FAD-dependent oxidoreductase n=1 Tax=Sphingomonas natans TaxID=3063330 RepID=A0ABT8YCD7_9SPHN|nr:NAD(P)-binding protein [Sphingomonas sp. BIUV-7]MDO6415984.1 FAD-dependent oxidoreductase [Sphingomonas sp. BIUV-7]